MREIQFRGKDVKTGEWRYGYYHFNGFQHIIYTPDDAIQRSYYVDSETVGQYIGLKDKNGKKIFKGDIVGKEDVYHFIDREGWEPRTGLWKIIGEKIDNFTGCGFEPFSDSENNCNHCGGRKSPKDYEIIGNIYENPELLTQ